MIIQEYPEYYTTITAPISISQIRKRVNTNQYKTVAEFRDDWRLMFNNARIFNQEDSWVYVDANELQKVMEASYKRHTAGTGLPGAEPSAGGVPSSPGHDDDDLPNVRKKARPVVIPDDDDFSEPDDDDSDEE